MAKLFTVVVEEGCGFTDQLTKLATVHEIGTRCGYEFRLTPPGGKRSDPGFWQHYDLSRVFPVLTPQEGTLESVTIDFPLERIRATGIDDLSALLRYVTARVPENVRLVVLDSRHTTRLREQLPLDSSPGRESFKAGIRQVFAPKTVWSPSRGLRILVHLRCGDVTDIPLVGPVSYRAWDRGVSIARPFWPTPFLGARLVVDTVRADTAPAPVDFRVFSDGYARTRRLVSRSADIGGSATRATRDILLRAIDIHEEAAGNLFRGADMSFSMGESFDSLERLIDSAQQADLIVITHAQRMIPKFLAALGSRGAGPGVLLLERSARGAKYITTIGMDESVARLITLSPHGDPLAPLRVFLAERATSAIPETVRMAAEQTGAGLYCVPDVESLAARLEHEGHPELAFGVYRRLSLLTDGSPASFSGLARSARAVGDIAVAEDARRRATEAFERYAAGCRGAIKWAEQHGYPHDVQAIVEEARRNAGPDFDLLSPSPG